MSKQLAKTDYSGTDKKAEFLEQLVPEKQYEPSDADGKVVSKILQRFTDMRSARKRIDNDWQTWQKIIESKFYPYADGRTRANVPLFRALQEIFVSEALSRRIQRDIRPIGLSDVDKAEVMSEVWDAEWVKNRRDEQMTEAEYKCSGIGTCAYFTGFEQSERVINDPEDELDENGDVAYRKKLMKQGRIILRTLDIRNAYFDDRVTCFDDCNDQIYVEYLTPEQFDGIRNNPNFKNGETVGTTSKSDQAYFTWEDTGKQKQGLVELLHYWNKQSDRYCVIANRSILLRDDPIPYAHKELPIVPRQYGFVADSIYGRGLAEACMQFLDKYNRLSEMLFDGISRSNNSIFAIGNGLTFDGSKFSFNNQVLKFNGQLNDANYREIKGNPPNQAAFSYLQDLLREIAIFVGIDPAQITGQASSTAFETAIRAESSLKRVNVVLTNRDYALQKVFQRHLSNLMQFFPLSEAERIVEVDSKGNVSPSGERKYPKILMDGKKYVPETGKIVEEPGKFEFEVKPEYIRGQMDVRVETNFSAPSLKSLKQESMKNFLNAVAQYSNLSVADPNLAKILPPDDFFRELAFTHDVDLDSIGGFADSVTKQKEQLLSVVRQMAGAEEAPGALP